MFNRFRTNKLFAYTPNEVSEHLATIADLHRQRDKTMQLLTLSKDDRYAETLKLIDSNIETAQRVLKHMLERNEKAAKGK